MKRILFLTLILLMGVQLSCAAEENLALNKSYTLEPAPNYDLCTDADDAVQLTDGKTTNGYFWTQQGTVGWRGVSFGLITVDLGRIEPISGFEFTTAAGAGGVEFPVSVRVDVSDDGETYYESADLVADTREALGEFPTKYAIVCLKSKPVRTRGRYVRIMAIESGPYLFCDEIRVIPGDASLLTADLKRVPVSGTPADVYRERKMAISIDRRIQTDCEAVMKIVGDSENNLSAEERVALKNELASSASGAASWDVPKDFRAVLPLNENHAGVYRVLSKAWNAAGFRGVVVSPANVWDFTNRFDYPKRSESPEISLALMQKEPRAAVLNAYNATQTPVDLKFKVKETPALKVKAYRAVWTDTSVLEPVLDALVPVTPDGSGVLTLDAVPSGLVTQLWLVFEAQSGATSVQKLESSVTCENTGETFPVRATVYPREFPQQTRLLLGGWDYTNGGGSYNVNRTNLDSFLETVRAGRVNAPWGSPSLLENCEVNPDDLSVKINTDMFDEWIERWPKSVVREYFVFLAKGGYGSETTPKFKGYEVGTKEFHTVVKNLYAAWRAHWLDLGLDPAKFNLLIHDEPTEDCKDYAPFIAWSDAIHAGCPEVRVWEDPCFTTFPKEYGAFFDSIDVLCPKRTDWLERPAEMEEFYLGRQKSGQTLDFYSCSGPMKTLCPYTYVLSQALHAAKIGARASFFWALGDGGGVSSWNEYYRAGATFTPLYIDPNDSQVTLGKHFEAMRESAQDYEYCMMFREKLDELRRQAPERADALESEWNKQLNDVLQQSFLEGGLQWKTPKDTTGSKRLREWTLEQIFN